MSELEKMVDEIEKDAEKFNVVHANDALKLIASWRKMREGLENIVHMEAHHHPECRCHFDVARAALKEDK